MPTLILHGTRDDSVPIVLSRALRHARPDLVEMETFDAGHTLCWNTDPDRWQEAVTAWLTSRLALIGRAKRPPSAPISFGHARRNPTQAVPPPVSS